MRRISSPRVWISLLVVVVLSCGVIVSVFSLGGSQMPLTVVSNDERSQSAGGAAPGASGKPTAPERPAAQPNAPADSGQSQLPFQRLVIKTATIEAEAEYEKLGEATARVEALVSRLRGYIVSTDDQTSNASYSAHVTIAFRVPSDKFEEAMRSLDGEGIEIKRRQISGDDVTEEFVDNEARLVNLEATAARLRDVLNKATEVNDIIAINNQLSQYEGQIEQIRGRQKFLQDSAAMSLITMTISSKPVDPPPAAGSWSPSLTARRAWADLLELGQGLINVLIVLAIWTPVWLPFVLIIWRLVLWIRGPRPVRQTASPTAEPAPPSVPATPAT